MRPGVVSGLEVHKCSWQVEGALWIDLILSSACYSNISTCNYQLFLFHASPFRLWSGQQSPSQTRCVRRRRGHQGCRTGKKSFRNHSMKWMIARARTVIKELTTKTCSRRVTAIWTIFSMIFKWTPHAPPPSTLLPPRNEQETRMKRARLAIIVHHPRNTWLETQWATRNTFSTTLTISCTLLHRYVGVIDSSYISHDIW